MLRVFPDRLQTQTPLLPFSLLIRTRMVDSLYSIARQSKNIHRLLFESIALAVLSMMSLLLDLTIVFLSIPHLVQWCTTFQMFPTSYFTGSKNIVIHEYFCIGLNHFVGIVKRMGSTARWNPIVQGVKLNVLTFQKNLAKVHLWNWYSPFQSLIIFYLPSKLLSEW